jgi:hypothetical protein
MPINAVYQALSSWCSANGQPLPVLGGRAVTLPAYFCGQAMWPPAFVWQGADNRIYVCGKACGREIFAKGTPASIVVAFAVST